MSYEMKVHGKIGADVRRIAEEEITGAIKELEALRRDDVARFTHEARKHFKKLRALLQLVRDDLGKRTYTENVCFRDAGRQLRGLRDAQVLVSSLDTISQHFFKKKRPAVLSQARKLLAREEQRAADEMQSGARVRQVISCLRAAVVRVRGWNLNKFGWKETRRGAKRSYQRARQAFHRALDDPSDENLHEWRKRVKTHWYHARLLHRACPKVMEELAHELDVLSELIGNHHDLGLLRYALQHRRRLLKNRQQLDAFFALLEVRCKELRCAAFDLAGRLYAETPGAFANRLTNERKIWRRASRWAKQSALHLNGSTQRSKTRAKARRTLRPHQARRFTKTAAS